MKLISEWLHHWHKRGSLTIRGCIDDNNSIAQDVDHDYELSDSDDNSEESLKNVLLVTGPVGVCSALPHLLAFSLRNFRSEILLIYLGRSDNLWAPPPPQELVRALPTTWIVESVVQNYFGSKKFIPNCSCLDPDIIHR